MKSKYFLFVLLCAFCFTNCTNTIPTSDENDWEELPEKVDILAFMAHPDDEGYWGGTLTYYSKCLNKKVALVCMTSGEWGNGLPHPIEEGEEPDCSYNDTDHPCWHKIPEEELVYPCYYRETEMENAAKVYGLKYKTIHPRFNDMASIQPWGEEEGGFAEWGGKERVLDTMVYYIRKLKPDVVLGLSWHGGNGNPQHIAVGRGAVYAAELSGKESSYPEQLSKVEPWEPKKVYLHLQKEYIDSTENYLTHNWEIKCDPNDSLTVREISAKGIAQHECQVSEGRCREESHFELRFSTVGKDSEEAKDFFENIE